LNKKNGRKRLKEAELLQIIAAAIKEVSRTPISSINKHTLAALYVILNVYLPWKRNEVCFLKINQENIREEYIEKDGRKFKLPSVIWKLLRKRTLVTCEDSYIFNYVAGESVVFEKFGERMNELLYDFIYESDEINMKLIGVDVFPTEAIKHTVLYILANDSNFEFTPPKLSAISGLSHSYVSVYYDFEREYNVTDFFEIWNKHF
jgi:integrase